MKKVIFLLMGMLSFVPGKAQVKDDTRAMILGSQPALTIMLDGVESKFAEAAWKEYVKSYGKVVKVKNSKESVMADVHVGDVGAGNLLDVYSLAEVAGGGTKFIVWVDMGDTFLTTKSKDFPRFETFLLTFAHKVKVDLVMIDLENQQKKLEKFESNYTKLQKENDNLHKLIADTQLKIKDAEVNIESNLKEQEIAQSQVKDQKAVVDAIQDNPDEMKAQQKLLSKLESNYDKLQRENDSLHKLIADSNAKIKQAELDIKTNLENQETALTEIDNQKVVLQTVDKKTDGPEEPEAKIITNAAALVYPPASSAAVLVSPPAATRVGACSNEFHLVMLDVVGEDTNNGIWDLYRLIFSYDDVFCTFLTSTGFQSNSTISGYYPVFLFKAYRQIP